MGIICSPYSVVSIKRTGCNKQTDKKIKGIPKNIRDQDDFFSNIIKQTGSNNCKQGGKNLQNS